MELMIKILQQYIQEECNPHFEILKSAMPESENILAFFLMDTDYEWKLMQESQKNGTAEEWAELMEGVKEEFLETVGFDREIWEKDYTEKEVLKINKRLEESIEKLGRQGMKNMITELLLND